MLSRPMHPVAQCISRADLGQLVSGHQRPQRLSGYLRHLSHKSRTIPNTVTAGEQEQVTCGPRPSGLSALSSGLCGNILTKYSRRPS